MRREDGRLASHRLMARRRIDVAARACKLRNLGLGSVTHRERRDAGAGE